ncbi:hypothetical protein [Streptomyces lunaelactis]|uniref:hypothetical protein n=1 Tax=Streptomyces lunaelactis TaxID=1535768 RepID=UPI0015846B23|nr:hypothetical protein [Streptomyces lunaelactis]NUK02007.1 hypothetical protein [Streptomyces lunaelactis]NUK18499.1 hypothetical protein [Streptomyces lunaelactis]
MNGKWFLVKYIDDVFRNEPINVGVVVTSEEGVGSRFLGQRPDGSINGQRIGKRIAGVETYKAWVKFIRKEAARGTLEDRIEKLARRVGESYVIERRGPILDGRERKSPTEVADELFVALVSADAPPTLSLDALAERAFKRLALPPGHVIDHNVDYKVKIRDVPQLVTFDYRYAADRVTLMDRVSFARHGKPLMQSVNDLAFRIEAIEKQEGIQNFVALYSGADHSPQVERHLRVLDRFARTVDLNSAGAEEDIGEILGVPALPG